MNLRNFYFIRVIDDAESIQQPDHDTDHHYNIENFFDLAIHWNVGVDQPKQNAHDNQSYYERYQWHKMLMVGKQAKDDLPASRRLFFDGDVVFNVSYAFHTFGQTCSTALLRARIDKPTQLNSALEGFYVNTFIFILRIV